MAKLTPITKQDLVNMGIKFASVTVPVFPVNVKKTIKMKVHLFDDLDQAKANLVTLNPLIIFDTEQVYGEKAIQESKKVQTDKFYIRVAEDVTHNDWIRVLDNLKEPKDSIYHILFDLSHIS